MDIFQDTDLVSQAKAIPIEQRRIFLTEIPERELHEHLAALFERVESGTQTEITHGADEFGRDIVLRRRDAFGVQHIGVVVKRSPDGRMSGRTSGVIDEVISQANQAVSHPCQLKGISVERVTIDSVWIALFGRLSTNAAQRLNYETRELYGIRILLLDQLEELFTNYYPQVFLGGKESEYLANKIVELESWTGVAKGSRRLSDWFVDPMVAEGDGILNLTEEGIRYIFTNRKLPFVTLSESVLPRARLVLTGDPGSGKSTALRKLAIDLLHEANREVIGLGDKEIKHTAPHDQLRIPILIDAVSTVEGISLPQLLEGQLPPDSVRSSFQVSLILLDGLDEIPKASHDQVIRDAIDLANSYECCLIISCRKVPSLQLDFADQSSDPVKVFDILPFEMNQALDMVKRMAKDTDLARILSDGLMRIQHQIVFTPLALELLIEVAEAEKEIPGSISEIFDRYMDLALGRYDSQRGIQVVFDYFIKKRFLADLAWSQFKEGGRLELPRSEFDEHVKKYIATFGWDPQSFDTLVMEIERSGVLRMGETVFFSHRSFLEFFVAHWVYDNREKIDNYQEQIVELYFDVVWSEVALYAVGLTREIDRDTIDEIMTYQDGGLDSDLLKYMLGRLLQAAWHSPSEVKRLGIEEGMTAGEKVLGHLKDLQLQDADHVPTLFPYFFLLAFSEYAYGSRTLLTEVKLVLEQYTDASTSESFFRRLALLWAVRERISEEEIPVLVNAALEHLAKVEKDGGLGVEERFLGLLFLEQASQINVLTHRQIRRKTRRLARKHPSLGTGLLGSLLGIGQGKRGRRKAAIGTTARIVRRE